MNYVSAVASSTSFIIGVTLLLLACAPARHPSRKMVSVGEVESFVSAALSASNSGFNKTALTFVAESPGGSRLYNVSATWIPRDLGYCKVLEQKRDVKELSCQLHAQFTSPPAAQRFFRAAFENRVPTTYRRRPCPKPLTFRPCDSWDAGSGKQRVYLYSLRGDGRSVVTFVDIR